MLMKNLTALRFHQTGDCYHVVLMYLSFINSFSKHILSTYSVSGTGLGKEMILKTEGDMWLAQLVEHATIGLRVVSSSSMLGVEST